MMRKECDRVRGEATKEGASPDARSGGTVRRVTEDRRSSRPRCARNLWIWAIASCLSCASASQAGTIRLWPSAVVVEDHVRVHDLCELRGFDATTEKQLASAIVTDAPAVGGSRMIHLELVRSALTTAGVNPAQVTVSGATQCAVSRPTAPRPAPVGTQGSPQSVRAQRSLQPNNQEQTAPGITLRQSVIDYFSAEFARYGGTAEVVFDRTSDQVLDLSGPAYEFKVRRRSSQPLGLCPLEVDVLAAGKAVQTVPLVVQVTMIRRAVVARRTINLDATIATADVDLSSLSFSRLDELGLDNMAQVVGQRAKKVIPAGTLIESAMLESVPLVVRGQLVTLTSTAGAVRVVTTGKAAADGRLGELIKVRSVDDKRVEFDAVVTGPGEVEIGARAAEDSEPRLALGAGS